MSRSALPDNVYRAATYSYFVSMSTLFLLCSLRARLAPAPIPARKRRLKA